jgi:RimJ/RimL family protein N-acetyltransferase
MAGGVHHREAELEVAAGRLGLRGVEQPAGEIKGKRGHDRGGYGERVLAIPLPDPPLVDDRVRLRPWREADLPAAHAGSHDPLVPRFTNVPERQSRAELTAFMASHEPLRRSGAALELAIADAADDAFLGTIGLLRIDWPNARGEVGYWLAPHGRGRGAATSAVRLLARWALAALPLARIELHTDPDNAASRRVAARAGFTEEGVLRSYDTRKGRRYDSVVHSLLPGDLAGMSEARLRRADAGG